MQAMWAVLVLFFAFAWNAVLAVQHSGVSARALHEATCKRDSRIDIWYDFGECVQGRRNAFFFTPPGEGAIKCCGDKDDVNLAHTTGLDCMLRCPASKFLDATLHHYNTPQQKFVDGCAACPPGRFSLGGGAMYSGRLLDWHPKRRSASFYTICLSQDFNNVWHKNKNCSPWVAEGGGVALSSGANSAEVTNANRQDARANKIESVLYMNVNLVRDGTVSFRFMVEAEQDFDGLSFVIDNDEVMPMISVQEWKWRQFSVKAGSHTFMWVFEKDFLGDSGRDAALISDVKVTGTALSDLSCRQCSGYAPVPGQAPRSMAFSFSREYPECLSCPANEYVGAVGGGVVKGHGGSANSASQNKAQMKATERYKCFKCAEDEWSPAGSVERESCQKKPQCGRVDYMLIVGACDQPGEMRKQWFELDGNSHCTPLKALPSGVHLDHRLVKCPKCPPGHFRTANQGCPKCPTGEVTLEKPDVSRPATPSSRCRQCTPGQYAYRQKDFGGPDGWWGANWRWMDSFDHHEAQKQGWRITEEEVSTPVETGADGDVTLTLRVRVSEIPDIASVQFWYSIFDVTGACRTPDSGGSRRRLRGSDVVNSFDRPPGMDTTATANATSTAAAAPGYHSTTTNWTATTPVIATSTAATPTGTIFMPSTTAAAKPQAPLITYEEYEGYDCNNGMDLECNKMPTATQAQFEAACTANPACAAYTRRDGHNWCFKRFADHVSLDRGHTCYVKNIGNVTRHRLTLAPTPTTTSTSAPTALPTALPTPVPTPSTTPSTTPLPTTPPPPPSTTLRATAQPTAQPTVHPTPNPVPMVDCDVLMKFTIDGRVPNELQRGEGLTTADGEGHQSPVMKMKPGKHKLSWTWSRRGVPASGYRARLALTHVQLKGLHLHEDSRAAAMGSSLWEVGDAVACKNCPAGFRSNARSSSCIECEAGKYLERHGGHTCEVCPAGKFSGVGFASCQPCGAHMRSAAGATICSPDVSSPLSFTGRMANVTIAAAHVDGTVAAVPTTVKSTDEHGHDETLFEYNWTALRALAPPGQLVRVAGSQVSESHWEEFYIGGLSRGAPPLPSGLAFEHLDPPLRRPSNLFAAKVYQVNRNETGRTQEVKLDQASESESFECYIPPKFGAVNMGSVLDISPLPAPYSKKDGLMLTYTAEGVDGVTARSDVERDPYFSWGDEVQNRQYMSRVENRQRQVGGEHVVRGLTRVNMLCKPPAIAPLAVGISGSNDGSSSSSGGKDHTAFESSAAYDVATEEQEGEPIVGVATDGSAPEILENSMLVVDANDVDVYYMQFAWYTAAACPLCRAEWYMPRVSECYANTSTQHVYYVSAISCVGGAPAPATTERVCTVLEVTEDLLTTASMAAMVAVSAVILLMCYVLVGIRQYRTAHKNYTQLRAKMTRQRRTLSGAVESSFDFDEQEINGSVAVAESRDDAAEDGAATTMGGTCSEKDVSEPAFCVGEADEDFFADDDHGDPSVAASKVDIEVEMTNMIAPAQDAGIDLESEFDELRANSREEPSVVDP